MESLDEKEWFLLYELSKIGALVGISKTTTEIASLLSSSQQTISRRLKSLKEKGFIINTIKKSEIQIKISEKGKVVLSEIFQNLKNVLVEKARTLYYGQVQTGLGEGKFYIQLPEYNIQFTNLLKTTPYPGTLNILLEREYMDDFYYSLSQQEYLSINGFESMGRTFGEVKCYKISITANGNSHNEYECLLVDIRRTSHQKGTVEIVSNYNLRKNLNLEDGSLVRLSFVS
jgi:riboflavin kinase, archaea type